MKGYSVDQIRNIALLGHSSCGKTTLVESILYAIGDIKKMGSIDAGNTVSDFDKEEITSKISIGTSIIPVEYEGNKYNFIDTPGYFDFKGEVNSALRVSGSAIIVIDASSGVEVGTEKAWEIAEERKMSRLIFLNKMDKENIDFVALVEDLKNKFGKSLAPVAVPTYENGVFNGFINVITGQARKYNGTRGEDCPMPAGYEDQLASLKEMLIEAVAESDDALLDKYFNGEEFTPEELSDGLRKGVVLGNIVPVLMGSAQLCLGISSLLNMSFRYLPTPTDLREDRNMGIHPSNQQQAIRAVTETENFSAIVFKTMVDPFIGKISFFRVLSGVLKKDDEVYNSSKDQMERISTLFYMKGKTPIQTDKISVGDIGATSKLQYTDTSDTLCDKNRKIVYARTYYPDPCYFIAVQPKDKKDEDKIGQALQKLAEEDPTFVVTRNKETNQTLLGGQGNMQLQIICNKLKNRYGVSVDVVPQKVPYRETIKGSSDVEGKHKKQTGGAGQYGHVFIRFSPSPEEFEFTEEIFGGSVPKQYVPAVEKGLREAIVKGALAGYPVVNVKAVLYDGSYHDVDSNENAFKMAASIAFKKGMEAAKPTLLEPVMKLEITVPDAYMGDVIGDVTKRRGKILGMEQARNGYQKIIAEAPQAELFTYAIDLRAMTQARASFTVDFERYEELPAHMQAKVIEEYNAERAKD